MLLAGQENLTSSLTFTLFLLSKNPEFQECAAKECALLKLSSIGTVEELHAALPFTYACYCEALRMYPPTYNLGRQAVKNTQVGKFIVPEGCSVAFNVAAIYNQSQYYANPAKYNPERFMAENPEFDARPPIAFMPFGIGQRECLGKRYAVLVALLCLAELLSGAKFSLHEQQIKEEKLLEARPSSLTTRRS